MVAPGVLWVVVLFTGVLGLNRAFGAEVDRGSLSALLLAPVDRSAIYFGKLLAQLIFMLGMEIVIVPLMLVVFDVNLFSPWILLGLLLGTVGLCQRGRIVCGAHVQLPSPRIHAAHPVVAGDGARLRGRHRAHVQHPGRPRIRRLRPLAASF